MSSDIEGPARPEFTHSQVVGSGEVAGSAVTPDLWDGRRPRPAKRPDEIPTRVDMQWWSDAEMAISKAMAAVEKEGASPALTEAVALLAKAQSCVADHIEGVTAPDAAEVDAVARVIYECCPDEDTGEYVDGLCVSSGGMISWERAKRLDAEFAGTNSRPQITGLSLRMARAAIAALDAFRGRK